MDEGRDERRGGGRGMVGEVEEGGRGREEVTRREEGSAG